MVSCIVQSDKKSLTYNSIFNNIMLTEVMISVAGLSALDILGDLQNHDAKPGSGTQTLKCHSQ